MVFPLKHSIIYGPVNSRRLGRSLGINLSPVRHKLCSFNCVYCHYGWTERVVRNVDRYADEFPKKQDVFTSLRQVLENGIKPDYITFSGNGEPTLHPDFQEIVEGVARIRDELTPDVPLALLSNSSALSNQSVRSAISLINTRILKLDAGTEEVFQKINKPAQGILLKNIVDSFKGIGNFIIQTIFINGNVSNTKEENISRWIEIIKELSPISVQVYSTDRPVPQKDIEKVEVMELRAIASRTEQLTSIPVKVFSLS